MGYQLNFIVTQQKLSNTTISPTRVINDDQSLKIKVCARRQLKVYCDQKLVWRSSALFPLYDLTVCFLLLTSHTFFWFFFTCSLCFKTMVRFNFCSDQFLSFFMGYRKYHLICAYGFQQTWKSFSSSFLAIYCHSFPSSTFVVSFRFFVHFYLFLSRKSSTSQSLSF